MKHKYLVTLYGQGVARQWIFYFDDANPLEIKRCINKQKFNIIKEIHKEWEELQEQDK
jgi:hypothetical protein